MKKREKISGKYIGPLMLKFKWQFIIGITMLVIVDLFQLKIPEITRTITDGLNNGTMTKVLLFVNIRSLLFVGLVMGLGRFAWRYFIFGTSRKIEYYLRKMYFEHLEEMSLNFYNRHKTGDLMAYAINDLNAIRMMVGPGILMVFDASILAILVIVRMLTTINIKMTLLALMPFPLIAIFTLLLGNQMRIRFKEKQEAFAKLTEIVQENISGIRVVKAFVQEAKEQIAFNVANKNNYDKNISVVKIRAVLFPMITVISGLSIALVVGVGGYFAMIGTMSVGDFVALIQYLMLLVWPMIAVGWCANIISMGLASLKRYQDILSVESEVFDHDGVKAIKDLKGNIEIKDLTFAYEEDLNVLKNISLSIKQGQTIGIIGRTGSGKTTLMNLFVRLFNPPKNTIMIDGHDIMDISLKTLRQAIGYVPQDNFLFSDTIYNNIGLYGDYSEKDIHEMAKKANVHQNIIEFADGYETVVGERGVTLSGGQKQRISIARALIKEAEIMVLDDALSAVDTGTEEQILAHLKETRADKTTIIISHRISTIQEADQIFVFDEGKIVEAGQHKDLVQLEGLYYDMVKKQQLEHALALEE